ncbi:hypothetical protein N9E98_00730 [Candidatus Pelagibacter sp.]|nr:hypothetical protein [Candidatus Pelagibacter sp.]
MKNKILYFFLIFIFFNFSAFSADQFNFDITEVEILKNGDVVKGTEGGMVTTDDGLIIIANTFVYDKLSNILTANGNVEIEDLNRNLKIFSDTAIYKKNSEILITNYNSKAIYDDDKLIFGNTFTFDRTKNLMNANGDVKIEDLKENNLIFTNDITYYKNLEKIITKGSTKAFIQTEGSIEKSIQSKYKINSSNVTYLLNEKILSSQNKTRVEDQKSQVYFLNKFNYSTIQEILKGEKILIITNYNLPKSDKTFLENAVINLKDNNFIAKETEIQIHKTVFDKEENDPRIKGVSSRGEKNYTIINKGIFTSCKKNDKCPPWSIKATKITHDKVKKQIKYDNALLKVYDVPVFYFPKFFHPDPTVVRQSGLLKQQINNSELLGSSLTLPYFLVISDDKDLTLTPTWFDTKTEMISAEYRQANQNSYFLADTAFVNGYESFTTKKKNSLSHILLNYNKYLNFENYISSDLIMAYEKVSTESYFGIFDQYVTKSKARPENFNNLNNHIKLKLQHENYKFETGMQSYESIKVEKSSDRFSYNLPYYSFVNEEPNSFLNGNITYGSRGDNRLSLTNRLHSNITNNISFNSYDYISNLGFKKNFGANYKNLNYIGKKSDLYKSSPTVELVSIYNADLSLPLIKDSENFTNLLTPKLSLRFNPSDMRNYSTSERIVGANNVFAINRFGLSDSYESGRSLTLGIDYKSTDKDDLNSQQEQESLIEETSELNDINNYFEIKLATVLRDKEETSVPNKSSLNRTNSNLFGAITGKISDNIEVGYDFSLDNDYNTLEYNNINTKLSFNEIVADFNFIETIGERGDSNLLITEIDYNLDGTNSLQFKTRRNRVINFTEYYDLVYQYKNDCLTAAIKYKKTYYTDGDVRPNENLFFTITLFPLTSYEHDGKDLLKNDDSFLNNLELSDKMFK